MIMMGQQRVGTKVDAARLDIANWPTRSAMNWVAFQKRPTEPTTKLNRGKP